jgi:hypothetical protein
MMQLVLIVLTKRKEMIRCCELFGYDGPTLSNIVANDLTHVNVPVEEGSIIPVMGISHRPHHGLFTNIPFTYHWYFRTHYNVLQAKHKQPNFHKQKRSIRKS